MPKTRPTYHLIGVTAAAIAIMLVLTVGAVIAVRNLNYQLQSEHTLTRLDSVVRLLEAWRQQYLRSLPLLTENTDLARYTAVMIGARQSGGTPDRSDTIAFEETFVPRYRSMGYSDYSIISNDMWLLASSVAPTIHRRIESPDLVALVERVLRERKPLMLPLVVLAASDDDEKRLSGQMSLVLCAPLQPTPRMEAVLCLRIDTRDVFNHALITARVGKTGEAYIINGEGRILSPSRFIAAPSIIVADPLAIIDYPTLWTVEPPHDSPAVTSAVDGARHPLTAVAAAVLREGKSGYMEEYLDYRGRLVVGAGRWLDSMGMGVIIEQDMIEVYTPHRLARGIMLGLGALEIFLVAAVALIFMRGRRDLAAREARIRHLVGNMPALIFLKDRAGRLQLVNPAFERETGIEGSQCLGKPLAEVLPPQWDRLFHDRGDSDILSGHISDEMVELPPALRTDTRRFFRMVRFPVFNGDQAAESIGTIAINTTDVWHYRMELESLNRDLEHIVDERTALYLRAKQDAEAATRAKSEFLANMSHEIRTPLNAIIGLSYVALNDKLPEKTRDYLQKVQDAGQHLLDIINSILDFSKIEAGKLSVESRPFSLQQLLDNVISFIWQRADSKGLEIIADVDAQLPPSLIGDSLRIGQILINFCNNAVKFTESGEVALRIEQLRRNNDEIWVRFAVSDSGIGIDEAELQKLFQPFHQVDNSSTRRFEGTGLGLAICKNLTELLGGRIAAHSTPGKGSIFAIEIPLRAEAAAQPVLLPLMSACKRVLVVDDNAHARQLLGEVLRSLSFHVSEADSGAAALKMIDASGGDDPFAMVFLDWKMPGLSGVETAQCIAAAVDRTTTHLILVTPHHSAQGLDDSAIDLFAATLPKPITASLVFDTIAKLLLPDYQPVPRHVPAPRNQSSELKGARVLLVEDNDINQEVAVAMLRAFGMEVAVAHNGLEAINKVRSEYFDVVLMDVQMPLLDGYAATRSIRADTAIAQPPIIAMTANAMQGDRDACIAAGMNDYVAKPIRPSELEQTLSRWVRVAPTREIASTAAELPYAQLELLGLDTRQALTLLMERDELYAKVLRRFVADYADTRHQLERMLATQDYSSATRLLHSLKSAAATIGANPLHRLCTEAEAEMKQQSAAENGVDAVAKEVTRLVAGIEGLLLSRGP